MLKCTLGNEQQVASQPDHDIVCPIEVTLDRLSPSHTRLTTRLRPTCDRKRLQSWANLRKNIRLVAEVVRMVAEVVGDRKGKISRQKVDGHVQNWSCHLTTGGTTNRLLTQNSSIDRTIDLRGPRLIVRSIIYGYHMSYDFLRYGGSCHRYSPIGVDRATTRTTNRTMTYNQQKRPIAVSNGKALSLYYK